MDRPVVVVIGDLRPTLSSDLDAVHAGDVVPELDEMIRSSGAARWMLLGADAEVVCRYADEVLSGGAAVFGLAGVVVIGDRPAGVPAGVPLLVLDEADDASAAVVRFWRERAGLGPTVPADFAAMIASDRVSARTRGIHARRALADDPAYAPSALDTTRLATLRMLADRVVPQDGPPIDLAARVDAQLARGEGDGWRHADLPPDLDAYRAALDELSDLADLTASEQDDVLTSVAAGERATTGPLSGEQLALWFEDACNDLVRQWVAHPATMSRIGYDGLANGGDDLPQGFQGFVRLGADEREDWEPAMTGPTETSEGTTR